MNIDITGGVSPLKARQASRGGKYAGKATSSAGRRGGFAKSTGARGAGGRNVGGYNVQTRFKPSDRWVAPASGGTTTIPSKLPTMPEPTKPPVVNGQPTSTSSTSSSSSSSTPGTPGTPGSPEEGYWKYDETTKKLPSYKQAWDKDLEGINTKYKTFEDYVADIEGQKKMAKGDDWEGLAKKKGVSVEEAKKSWERRKDKTGKWTWVKTKDAVAPTAGTSGSSSSESSSSSTSSSAATYKVDEAVGKYALGGYKAMKKNKK